MKTTPQLANEIIKIFIDNNTPLHQQLQVLKLTKEGIEFCKRTGAKMLQNKLKL